MFSMAISKLMRLGKHKPPGYSYQALPAPEMLASTNETTETVPATFPTFYVNRIFTHGSCECHSVSASPTERVCDQFAPRRFLKKGGSSYPLAVACVWYLNFRLLRS